MEINSVIEPNERQQIDGGEAAVEMQRRINVSA